PGRRCKGPSREVRHAEAVLDEACRPLLRSGLRAGRWCKPRWGPWVCCWRTSRKFCGRRIRRRIGRWWRVQPSRSCRGHVCRWLAWAEATLSRGGKQEWKSEESEETQAHIQEQSAG